MENKEDAKVSGAKVMTNDVRRRAEDQCKRYMEILRLIRSLFRNTGYESKTVIVFPIGTRKNLASMYSGGLGKPRRVER